MKFKQKLALSLCALYTISVLGFALSMHFCGGKLASVTAFSSKPACKYCKAEPVQKTDDDCCKNTKVEVKVKDSHQGENVVKLPAFFSTAVIVPVTVVELFLPSSSPYLQKVDNKAPPGALSVALHVFNCVFRN